MIRAMVIVLAIILSIAVRADTRSSMVGGLVTMSDNPDDPLITVRCRRMGDLILQVLGPDGHSIYEVRCSTEPGQPKEMQL